MERKEHLSVALAQYDIVWESPSGNCSKIEKILEECRSEIDLLVLPEAFNTGFSMNPRQLA
ncbi:MAG TPA: nitrilase-related carbon-nitrogen hydrolase, partial [Prolixibacteraceae bacterium]|nr:nitrilase-related carbon-nitrogen hydrolase [Prolixibacteraceae bacterium]